MKSLLKLTLLGCLVAFLPVSAKAIIFDTETAFEDNFVQTHGATGIDWNSAGYINIPNGTKSVLYSVGGSDLYHDADFYLEPVSVTFSFGAATAPSLSIYARVDPETDIGIAGYVTLAAANKFEFRLYNSANPTTSGVSSQLLGSTITLPEGVTIGAWDILTLTLGSNPEDAQTIVMTLSRGNDLLGTYERTLTTPITSPGAVGFRTNTATSMRMYEFSVIPEPSVPLLLLGASALAVAIRARRRLGM